MSSPRSRPQSRFRYSIASEIDNSEWKASPIPKVYIERSDSDSVSLTISEVSASLNHRFDGTIFKPTYVHFSDLGIIPIPSPEINKPAQNTFKRRVSVTFSTTVKRNGSVVQAHHPVSHGAIEEETANSVSDERPVSNPSYGRQSREISPRGSRASGEAPSISKPNSIYERPKSRGRNISYSTSRRCSAFTQSRNSSIAPTLNSTWSYQSKIYQESAKPIYDADNELVKVSRKLLRLQKYGLLIIFISINVVLIWATFTHYTNIWWLILPILSMNTFAQVFFALAIIATVAGKKSWQCIRRPKYEEPTDPEKIVMFLPCYNEDKNEMQASINSLVKQVKIEIHPRIIMIVIDGNAKAPGEDMSTQDFLLNEMFAGGERTVFTNGYIARDAQPMRVTVQEGVYQGVPYVVVAKARNQGKRDSLCFVRSFMYHYQSQSEEVPTMFDPDLFDYLGSILTDNGLDRVDYLTGMDGDTVFDDDCTYELIKAIRRADPKVVGVCGAVLVKFDDPPSGFFSELSFYFWTHLQNAEYMSTQGLRREFQSRVTGKVNCLPGCCQLIRVSEATFGDEVLRVNFGYVPKPNDLMTQQIMGVYSEDSLHASIIFSLFPKSQTAQALRARAYTTVPTSWKVYLSQRKRWALGSLCNESLMVFRRNILWIERITSIITITTWWIGPFIYSSVFGFLISIARHGNGLLRDKVFVGLVCVIFFRYFYTLMIVTWFPHNWTARVRFLIGFFINLVISPLMNIIVTIYSLLHCDEFSWGKTRISADGSTGFEGPPVAQIEPTEHKQSVERKQSMQHKQSMEHRQSMEDKHLMGQKQSMGQKQLMEKPASTDIERQAPAPQEREAYEVAKYTQKGPPF